MSNNPFSLARSIHKRSTKKAPSHPDQLSLEDLSFCVGRMYYSWLALLERTLMETGLDQHLKPGMGLILSALYEKDGVIIKEIANRVQLSYSSLTRLLGKMKSAHLIHCQTDHTDGRAVRVYLTPLSQKLKPGFLVLHQRLNRTLTAGLSKNEISFTRKAMAKMIDAMRKDEEQFYEHQAKANTQKNSPSF